MKLILSILFLIITLSSFAQKEEDIVLMKSREIKIEKSVLKRCLPCRTDEWYSFLENKCLKYYGCYVQWKSMKILEPRGTPAEYSGQFENYTKEDY